MLLAARLLARCVALAGADTVRSNRVKLRPARRQSRVGTSPNPVYVVECALLDGQQLMKKGLFGMSQCGEQLKSRAGKKRPSMSTFYRRMGLTSWAGRWRGQARMCSFAAVERDRMDAPRK